MRRGSRPAGESCSQKAGGRRRGRGLERLANGHGVRQLPCKTRRATLLRGPDFSPRRRSPGATRRGPRRLSPATSCVLRLSAVRSRTPRLRTGPGPNSAGRKGGRGGSGQSRPRLATQETESRSPRRQPSAALAKPGPPAGKAGTGAAPKRSLGRAQKFGPRRAGAAARHRPAIAKKAAESASLRTFGAAAPATSPKLEAASRRRGRPRKGGDFAPESAVVSPGLRRGRLLCARHVVLSLVAFGVPLGVCSMRGEAGSGLGPELRRKSSGDEQQAALPLRSSPSLAWVGMGGKVYGGVTIAGSRVLSEAEFYELADQHLWPRDAALPYERRVCGLVLTAPQRLAEPIPYWRPPGAVGVNVFRRTAKDAPPLRPTGGGKKKRPGSALLRGQSRLDAAAATQIDSQAGEQEAEATAATDGEKAGSGAEAK